MFDILPVEVAYLILTTAAHDAIIRCDLPFGLKLALLSKCVRSHILPILYHTLVVTTHNILALNSLASHSGVLCHVERMFVAKDIDHTDKVVVLVRLCTNLDWIESTWHVVAALQRQSDTRTRRLAFRFQSLEAVSHTLVPAIVADYVTHLEGYIFPPATRSPPLVDWVTSLLDAFPNLTHVALTIAGVEDSESADDPTIAPRSLSSIIRGFMSRKSVERVVLHITGRWAESTAVQQLRAGFSHIKDEDRVFIWVDSRRFLSWDEEEVQRVADTRIGLDVWAQGVPLISCM
ncbi:hypothetical protein EXIGLDRAFT_108739 [Exidia glandulosa HHB12029]|uniref:F-box domain-containing protein n=1 Tax=Exidia glandulosa HHB12029 TaxID=1314781 RepID=A0A165GS65_EXIGL|nr:hypothetical protein EXIGLDRAFT_108739 [Exidia glandulosa HHB12029]